MTCFPHQIIMNHIKNIEKKAGGVLLYIRDSIQYQNRPGGRLNKKDGLTRYGNSHVKDKTS